MGALNLLITGANGYLGREVVRQALIAGHSLSLVVRDAARCPIEWNIDQRITLVEADLAEVTALPQSDVLLHLAASMSGDAAVQQRDTVEATRHTLISAMRTQQPPALVLASSLSVYSAMGLAEGDTVTEDTALEDQGHLRDAYCRAKLGQELLFTTAAADSGLPMQMLRIGAIWGPGQLWNAHLGQALGPFLLRFGRRGQVPLSHVRHAAKALILAAEAASAGKSGVANVVDDDLPDRAGYIDALQTGPWPAVVLPMTWKILSYVARVTGSRLRPGLLRMPTLRFRMLPLAYSNERLKRDLVWTPDATFGALMAEAQEAAVDAAAKEAAHD